MAALDGRRRALEDETGSVENLFNLVFLALALGLLFLVLTRGRRQQQAIAKVQASLAPGREVMTAAGMYARVVALDGDVVVLEAAPGQQSRWARQAIVRVIDEPAEDAGTQDPVPPRTPTDEG